MGTSNAKPFRILALDGGGIKGTFTAAVLAAWEQDTGLRVSEHFYIHWRHPCDRVRLRLAGR
jgi:patatin-like phospholipase/acyl hydrolase